MCVFIYEGYQIHLYLEKIKLFILLNRIFLYSLNSVLIGKSLKHEIFNQGSLPSYECIP